MRFRLSEQIVGHPYRSGDGGVRQAFSGWGVTRPESVGRLYNAGGVRPLWQRYDYTSLWITSVLPTILDPASLNRAYIG
jgi:hypothetical protein